MMRTPEDFQTVMELNNRTAILTLVDGYSWLTNSSKRLMLITSSWIPDVLILSATLAFFLYKYTTRHFDYWGKRGVHSPKPIPLLGNMLDVSTFKITIAEWFKYLYDSTDQPYLGIFIFDRPALVLRSPQVIKDVLVKDFAHFMDRTIAAPSHDDIFANILFSKKSPDWKTLRSKMSPVFTSGKIKGMFPLMKQSGEDLNNYLEKNSGVLEAKLVCSKFAMEVLTRCSFGINPYCFDKDDAVFNKVGRSMFGFTWRNALVQTAYFFRADLVDVLHLYFFPTWVQDFLKTMFFDILHQRESSKVRNNDLIDILNDLKKDKEFCKDINFEGDAVVAQALQFFAAGFETSSTTMSFTLFELCLNDTIQNKVRDEIQNSIKKHGDITYDGIQGMKYLDMCIAETLRKYPVLPFLDRLCNQDYVIPGTNLVLEKGMQVYIPMFGLHYDEKFFPNPQQYIPERFANGDYGQDSSFYFPFGGGPRFCIGKRFGLTVVKLGLVYVLSQYRVKKADVTPNTIVFEPKSFVLQSTVGVPLVFEKITA